MEESFYEETLFYVPARDIWQDLVDDEEPVLEPAESVFDDILLFEVG